MPGRERPDLTGQIFEPLRVVELSHVEKAAYWKCVCTKCAAVKTVRTQELRNGRGATCKCSRKRKHGRAANNRYDPTYRSWYDMIRRCYNKKCASYRNYGAKGVTVGKRWLGAGGFERFLADMGEKPANKTLDRINPHGNYGPSNCRWATRKAQQENRRANWRGLVRVG